MKVELLNKKLILSESNLTPETVSLRFGGVKKRFPNTEPVICLVNESNEISKVIEQGTPKNEVIKAIEEHSGLCYCARPDKYGVIFDVAYLEEFDLEIEYINPSINSGDYWFKVVKND